MSEVQREVIAFGPFKLFARERLLERDGRPLTIGSRPFEILNMLVEHSGEVISKKDILRRVWADVNVDEVSLRVQIAALRRTLNDGENGNRYVTTVSGKGYCFVAPTSRSLSAAAPAAENFRSDKPHDLPARLTRIVGREDNVREISERLLSDRFVTIVGPAGIGKTTVAVSVGHSLLSEFNGQINFFDLGPLSDPLLVPNAIASTLNLLMQSADVTSSLIAYLRDKRLLMILDCCEHVVSSASQLAERIFQEAENVHILATSREALRVEGERAYQLSPLECPPEQITPTAGTLMDYAASRLFVDRVISGGLEFEATDDNAPVIGEICRKLDGIALAIELAAGCVNAFGLEETAALLDSRFASLKQGKRTALLRHQTLGAAIDWSYELLTEPERIVLRRLAVFVGIFTLNAAGHVVATDPLNETRVVDAIASLVAKSLVSATIDDTVARFRLLDTTRAYAVQKLVQSGEAEAMARRHAEYFCRFLERPAKLADTAETNNAATFRDDLGNVRAALEWSFLEQGDARLAVALAAFAAHFFLNQSLLTECERWSERAILALDDTNRGTPYELELQAAVGLSLMFTKGNNDQAELALTRALKLSEDLSDFPSELRLLCTLHLFNERLGRFYSALRFAQRTVGVAAKIGNPTSIAESHSALGISCHLEGQHDRAHIHLEAALTNGPSTKRISSLRFGFDYRNRAQIALARTLWLRGYPDQAVTTARRTVEEAGTLDHPLTLCIALIWAVSVHTWRGDLANAEANIEKFCALADRHSLAPYQAVGIGVKGELAIKRGDLENGISLLRRALQAVHENRYELLTSEFYGALAEGLAATGRCAEALSLIDEGIFKVDVNGDLFMKPELLRVRGNVLASSSVAEMDQAEETLRRAIDLAQTQGARGWELRSATSLALVLSKQSRFDEARDVLDPVFGRFKEGLGTADLMIAQSTLHGLVEKSLSHRGVS